MPFKYSSQLSFLSPPLFCFCLVRFMLGRGEELFCWDTEPLVKGDKRRAEQARNMLGELKASKHSRQITQS